MATKVENVAVAAPHSDKIDSETEVRGVIYRAKGSVVLPKADLPTDAKTALKANKFVDLGGISEAGIVLGITRDVTKVKDFGGKTIATPQTAYEEVVTVELVESIRAEALRTVFGEKNVIVAAGKITVNHKAAQLPITSYVLETVQGDNGIRRQVLSKAKVTSVGDVTMINSDIIKYSLTIEVFETEDGDYTLEYIEDPAIEAEGAGDSE